MVLFHHSPSSADELGITVRFTSFAILENESEQIWQNKNPRSRPPTRGKRILREVMTRVGRLQKQRNPQRKKKNKPMTAKTAMKTLARATTMISPCADPPHSICNR